MKYIVHSVCYTFFWQTTVVPSFSECYLCLLCQLADLVDDFSVDFICVRQFEEARLQDAKVRSDLAKWAGVISRGRDLAVSALAARRFRGPWATVEHCTTYILVLAEKTLTRANGSNKNSLSSSPFSSLTVCSHHPPAAVTLLTRVCCLLFPSMHQCVFVGLLTFYCFNYGVRHQLSVLDSNEKWPPPISKDMCAPNTSPFRKKVKKHSVFYTGVVWRNDFNAFSVNTLVLREIKTERARTANALRFNDLWAFNFQPDSHRRGRCLLFDAPGSIRRTINSGGSSFSFHPRWPTQLLGQNVRESQEYIQYNFSIYFQIR